jgi:uncharacterized repeat protein (TIGR01451 family)
LPPYSRALILLPIMMLIVLLASTHLANSENGSLDSPPLWISTKPILIPNGAAGIALAFSRGHLYAIGGASGCGNNPLCIVYPSAFWGQLSLAGPVKDWMPVDNFGPIAFASAATTSDGWIYITGGASSITDPKGNTWYTLPSDTGGIDDWVPASNVAPFTPRFAHASVIAGSKLYVIGGFVDLHNILTDVSYADIDLVNGGLLNNWESTEPLTPARYGHSAVFLDNRIYVIGGVLEKTFVPTSTVVFAEPAQNGAITSWQPTRSLTSPIGFAATIAVPSTHKIYVFGGWNGGDTFSRKVYSAVVNRENGQIEEWIEEDSRFDLPEELYRHSVELASSGSVYLVAGKHPGDNERNSVYYIPPLTLTKSNDPSGPVHEGDVITYTISYSNTSLITQVITITDPLPFNLGVELDSIRPADKARVDGSTVIWELGEVPPGGSGQVSFRAPVALLPSLYREGISMACPTPEPTPLPPARVLPAAISCDTTRFWAHGITRQPPVSPPYTIEVQIPPNTNPSEMWLLMKGADNTAPRVEGQPAQVLTGTHNAFGASVWTTTLTSAMIADEEVTVVTDNPRELNALFLFDAKDPPFDERDLRVFAEAPTTFTYTLEIPSVEASTMDVLLPFMDITYWTDSSPPDFDGRMITVSVELEGEPTQTPQTITVNQPNMGNGLLMTQFPINLRPFTDTITKTKVLTISVDSEDDAVYTLGPRVCRPVYVENTAWLCSKEAGCISDTTRNIPEDFAPLSIYLPIILKSYP